MILDFCVCLEEGAYTDRRPKVLESHVRLSGQALILFLVVDLAKVSLQFPS